MEIAVGYVRLVADMQEAQKAIKQIEKDFSNATKNIQKEADKTSKSMQSMNKSFKDGEKQASVFVSGVSKLFASMSSVVVGFGGVISSTFKIAGTVFKAFIAIVSANAKVITTVFKGVISAVNGILASLVLLGSAGGKALTALAKSFKVLIDITMEYLKILKELALSFVTLGRVAIDSLTKLSKFLDDLTKKFVFVQLDIRYIIDQMKKFAKIFAGAIVGATASAVRFEEAFVKVRRVVEATEKEFKFLAQRFRDMSTETTSSAEDLAQVGFIAGQLGIEGVGNIEKFVHVIDRLTQVTNIVGDVGAAQFAKLMVVMNEPLENMENLASAVVDLGRNFAVFEDEILDMSKVVAGTASAIGLTTDQILALSAAMSAAGVRAERGGSAMSRIILEMSKATKQGGKRLDAFAELVGITSEEFIELIENSPEKAILRFIAGIKEVINSGGDWVSALEDVGLSQIRVRDVILRLANAGDVLNRTLDVSAKAYEEGTALAQEFGIRMSTVWAQIKMLGSELMELVRIIGTPFLGVTKQAVGILRVVARTLREIDPEKIQAVAGFLALGAAIFTFVTFVLMSIKAIFTLATGLTLLARLATFLLPILGIATLFSKLFDDFDMDNLIKQFFELQKTVKDLLGYFKELYEDVTLWFKESQTIQEWSETVRAALEDIQEAWDNFQNDDSYGAFEFSLDLAEISTSAVSEMLTSLEGGIQRLTDYIDDTDLNVFNEEAMSAEMRDNKWAQIALNLANILRLGFKIAFIDLPGLMSATLEASGLKTEAENVANIWWQQFKDTVLSKLPSLFDDASDRLTGLSEFIDNITISEEWATKSISDIEDYLNSEDMDPLWRNILISGAKMGRALKDVFASSFGKLHETMQKAIDWDKFWIETRDKMVKGVNRMNSVMKDALENIRKWDTSSRLEHDNPLIESLINFGSTLFAIYVELLIKALMFAFQNVPWAKLGKTIAEGIVSGISSTLGDWFEKNRLENPYTQKTNPQTEEQLREEIGKILDTVGKGFNWLEEGTRMAPPQQELKEEESQSAIEKLVRETATSNQVNADLAAAVAQAETNFQDVKVINADEESYGPMQINRGGGDLALKDIARYGFDPAEMENVEGRVEAGVLYIKWLIETQEEILEGMVEAHKEITTIEQAAIIAYRGIEAAKNLTKIEGTDLKRLDIAKSYGLSSGAILPGFGGGDQIPAMLEPGEAVVPARVVAGGMSDIVNWFRKNGVGMQSGYLSTQLDLERAGSAPMKRNLVTEEFLESISEYTGISVDKLDGISESTDALIDVVVNLLDSLSVDIIGGIDSFGNLLINLLSPIIGAERTEKLEGWLEMTVTILEELRTFAGDYIPELVSLLGGDGKDSKKPGGDPSFETVSLLQKIKTIFSGFVNTFSHVVNLWDSLAYILGENARRTYDLMSGISSVLQVLAGNSEAVNVASESLQGVRDNIEKLTGSRLLGNLAGGAVGAATYGQGGNIAGAVTGGLAGLGAISPVFAVASNIIGGLVKREEVSPEYTKLKDQINNLNSQLKDWGHSFQAIAPTKKNTANWFEKLFGGREYSYQGMERAQSMAQTAQDILQRLEGLYSSIYSGLASAFSAETFADFVDSFGRSLYNTVRESLIQAFMETKIIDEKLKRMALITETGIGVKNGQPFLKESAKEELASLFQEIKTISEPFYQMLSELEIAGYGAAEALDDVTESLRNVPEVFKISLERFRAAYPQGGTERFPSAATGAFVKSSGLVDVHAGEIIKPLNRGGGDTYIIEFSGDVYGVDNIVDVVARALDELDTDVGLVTKGVRRLGGV